ncbi:aldo/keto reductase [Paractinoplanes brasiliensis]|uniref:Aryl-alcohol dehydrogenase-like predicted oxidoreductase n=1 Tax=Paractinoplanes brasiliensis TaxID=52695 RepID=A0A4R6JDT0_9ACTN|nr:aldo/keto reductase [Actinoplanes brasiliensis]TDO32695.1 aryl-alcohol dehydrogenase-like predicted oxidoreductase [Actinoplanes brasiliensis]GID32828.1 oxidoreductase [Actinoplanes brasiliensis]
MELLDTLTGAGRIGLGLAAVGRPGYITLGRAADLPATRSVEALRERTHTLLTDAWAAGVRYFDVARSYGRAEEFLAAWLPGHPGAIVGSKWGYTYTAGWSVTADVHEVKDHSVATFDRQILETRALLGNHLSLYQIHSLTPGSPALTDTGLHHRLAALDVPVGFSTSGPRQAETIRAALAIEVNGARLFRSVQSTWNLLEPSAGPALAEAHAAGCVVIVKEALANGRLADPSLSSVLTELAVTPDVVATAAALQQPWSPIVLSGAATRAQLASNLRAADLTLSPGHLDRLATLAEPADQYWKTRAALAWS